VQGIQFEIAFWYAREMMSNTKVIRSEAHDCGWAERCAYWLSAKPAGHGRHGPAPRHTHEPLILTGHGLGLRVDHGALVVHNGFTHYPQRAEEYRFFKGDRNLPSRIIVLDGSGSLSFDVLSWLSEQEVPLIRINWRGDVVAAVGTGHTVDPRLVRQQLQMQLNGHAQKIAISLIRTKFHNCVETLLAALPSSLRRDQAIARLQASMDELTGCPPKTVGALLGLEGRTAFPYFAAWQSLPLRWKGTARHPIPRDWWSIGQRGTYARKKVGNRNASHPVNAILNYAYAVLESQVRIQVLAAGYDPTIGFLHSGRGGRHDFVFDLMEPMRPLVDRRVLEFVQSHTFHPADFTIRSDGVCMLNPEMARHVVHRIAPVSGAAVIVKQLNDKSAKR
jgi:CRISPR-associated protein Cas1